MFFFFLFDKCKNIKSIHQYTILPKSWIWLDHYTTLDSSFVKMDELLQEHELELNSLSMKYRIYHKMLKKNLEDSIIKLLWSKYW